MCSAHLNVHLMFRILRRISIATAFFVDCISICYFGFAGFMAVLSPSGQLLPKRAICDVMDDLRRHAKKWPKSRFYGLSVTLRTNKKWRKTDTSAVLWLICHPPDRTQIFTNLGLRGQGSPGIDAKNRVYGLSVTLRTESAKFVEIYQLWPLWHFCSAYRISRRK